MTPPLDKGPLLATLRATLAREIEVLTRAAEATRAGATHEEAKPENDKDTRAIEASYLAGAQAERVRELRESLAGLEALVPRDYRGGAPIGATALVTLEGENGRARYFVAPVGGGLSADFEGSEVKVITPRAPIGRALIGRREGDVVEVEDHRGQRREYEIVAVH